MWSSSCSASPTIPISTVAPLELISIRIPISPSPTYSSEYEASMIHEDHTIWKDGDGTCYHQSHEQIKSQGDLWKSKSYQPTVSPQPYIHTTIVPTRVESSQPTLSPYDTYVAPPLSPSPCSPIPHRIIRPASSSPVRFTFTPHHILSSQRRAIILASKQSKQQQPIQDIWHGDVSGYPCAPISLKLEKKWMTTSISAPQLTNVVTSTSADKAPVVATPTPTPTPVAVPDATPTPIATPPASSTFLKVPTLNVTTPSTTPLLKIQDDRTPTPFSSNSSITPSYTTPYTWRPTPSSSSTPLAPPTLSVRISIASPSPQPSTCPLAPRCLDPWITPDQRITPSMVSSY